jgi:hypothetical protein
MVPVAHQPAAQPVLPRVRVLTTRPKRPEDTPDGCRALAAEDLRRAEGLTADQARWRYEHSAQAWLTRADFLDGLEAQYLARVQGVAK